MISNAYIGSIVKSFGCWIRFAPICALAALTLTGCSKSEPNVFSTEAKVILEGRGAPTKAGSCALDSVNQQAATNGAFHAKAGAGALFSGWAWNMESNKSSNYLAVRLTEKEGMKPFYAYTSTRGTRGDVTTAYKIPADSKVSFELDASALPGKAGSYKVELLQIWDTAIEICEVPAPLVLE
jgi:hypothetical protein